MNMSLSTSLGKLGTVITLAIGASGCNTAERAYNWADKIGKDDCASVIEDMGDEARSVYGKTDDPDRDDCIKAAEPLARVQTYNDKAQLICLDPMNQQTAQGIQNGVNAAYRRACGTFVPTVK